VKYIKIALRNLSREKKRSFLLGGAIAFGLLIITVVNCASAGAVKAISENITKIADGHIFIQGEQRLESDKVVSNLADKDGLLRVIDESGINVIKMNMRSEVRAELIFGDNSSRSAVSGMNWDREVDVKNGFRFKEGSIDSINDKYNIIINEKLAETLNVKLGDSVIAKIMTVTGQTNVGDFIVGGILEGTDILSSMSSYANIDYINELIGLEKDDYQTIYIRLESIDVVDAAAEKLFAALSEEYQMKARNDNSDIDLFSLAFKNEDVEWDGQRYSLTAVTEMVGILDQFVGVVNAISFGVLLLLFLIIIVGVANTFRMIMYDRVKEIGSMRAMGMQKGGIRSIFLFEGFFLALAGAFSGIILAGILMFGLSFIDLGTDHAGAFFLNNGHLLFVPVLGPILLNILTVGLLTVLAVLFPANKAANLDPAKAIAAMY